MKPYKCECGGWITERNKHVHKCDLNVGKKLSKAKPEKERVSEYRTRYNFDE